MFAVWAAVNLIKQVIVVDDDVDPWNTQQVEWARATRVKPDRDFVIIPAVRTDRSEPLDQGGTVTKLGIDATRAPGDRADWDLARPPEAALTRARESFAQTNSLEHPERFHLLSIGESHAKTQLQGTPAQCQGAPERREHRRARCPHHDAGARRDQDRLPGPVDGTRGD
jgi:3-polyprenyl-4-hydroxybenzoate decarboxylase